MSERTSAAGAFLGPTMATAATTALHEPLDLPADRLAIAIGALDQPAILEGGPGFGEAGRWSIYAAEPIRHFAAYGPFWQTWRSSGSTFAPSGSWGESEPLAGLAEWIDELGLDDRQAAPPGPDEPPFRGGVIGYLGYDLAPQIERLPRKAERETRMPDIAFSLYDTAVAVDHRDGSVLLSAYDLLGDGEDALRERIERWRWRLGGPIPMPARSRVESPIAANFTRDGYIEAVERALEYIRAGDIFQVNLSQRFEARGPIDPLDLYRRLRRVSPAPYSAFLRWGDQAVVSSSPELFYQTWGDRLVTRPIKGTRPRGATPSEDAALADELRRSVKDRAELTMIVDLERNDLGRVCRYGTVRVTEPLVVESYAQVHHLVATVEGLLRPECGPVEVVRALHPGGSITGAPKIRAMEVIDELEPGRRGVYTGAIGYLSRGASAFNIAIRTMLVEGDRVTYQVGGGIVADSVPELEYEETLHKGRGMRAVLEGLRG